MPPNGLHFIKQLTALPRELDLQPATEMEEKRLHTVFTLIGDFK